MENHETRKIRKRPSAPFKSPLCTEASSRVPRTDEQRIGELKKRLSVVNAEVDQLLAQGYNEEELKTHIDKLHEYNEIKDVGQMVLGRLAMLQGVRTRDLYERYGLNLED